jgi:hypothetical protein
MAQNYAMDITYSEMKKWERKFSKGFITFKAGRKPKRKHESPIQATIEALTITQYSCCGRKAKIKPMLKITGCYCPFCGVKNFEVK